MRRGGTRFSGWFLPALLCAAAALLPFYWALSLSLRIPGEALSVSGPAVPYLHYAPTLANWRTELNTGEAQAALANSIWISLGAVLLTLGLGTPAAYALARFRFRFPRNRDLMMWFLSQRVLPPIATVIPFFFAFAHLRLLDTRLALVLINTTFCLPLVVVIMRQAFVEMPVELQ
jgi:multiple sugar transport system permease protein